MTLSDTLAQLPADHVVSLKSKINGLVTYDTASNWLTDVGDELDESYLLNETLHLSDGTKVEPGYPLPPNLRPYKQGDLGGTIPPPSDQINHGTIGEWLDLVEPNTEASAASLGLGVLCGLGAYMGRQIKLTQGNIWVTPNLFGVQVGPTGDARKGTADSLIYQLLTTIDQTFTDNITSGFGSGEMLVYKVSDPQYTKDNEIKSGTQDQRLLIQESELSKHLRIADRQGNTLSEILRLAFDCDRPLATQSRTGGDYKSTHHCISLFGGITPDELTDVFPALAASSGTGNRFLWVWSNPDKLLPTGGEHVDMNTTANKMRKNITQTRRNPHISFNPEAKQWWEQLPDGLYAQLRNLDVAPVIKPLVTRAYVQVMRVALIYAVSDGRAAVSVADLQAGLAWLTHSIRTVETILGGLVRDEIAATVLKKLRESPGVATTKMELFNLFSRNVTAAALDSALEALSKVNLAYSWTGESTGGRPPTEVIATTPKDGETSGFSETNFVRTPPLQAKMEQKTNFVENYEESRNHQSVKEEIENEESGLLESVVESGRGGTKEVSLSDLFEDPKQANTQPTAPTTESEDSDDELPDPY